MPKKRNEANGEQNRDGKNGEASWVGGDVRALLATLLLSVGTPMLTAGDEFGRTQNGNNNAYAQDNETIWLDWQNADHDLTALTRKLLSLRKSLPVFASDQFLKPETASWFDATGDALNWSNPHNRFVGLRLAAKNHIAIVINGASETQPFPLNNTANPHWMRLFSSTERPGDCPPWSVTVFRQDASDNS